VPLPPAARRGDDATAPGRRTASSPAAADLKPFLDGVAKLTKALEGFSVPNAIKLETNARVEVVLNGAQMLAAMKGDATREILNQVMPRLEAEVRRIFAEMPAR
jgi:hypothetical protein